MHNIKPSLEYAGQACSVFVKPLTQRSALAAVRSERHSRFALHPRSKTIRLRIKQGMAARFRTGAGAVAQERGSRRAKKRVRWQHELSVASGEDCRQVPGTPYAHFERAIKGSLLS